MFLNALLIGVIGTLISDLIIVGMNRLFKTSSLDFSWVGRWFLYMMKGQYQHHTILQSPAIEGEKPFGWLMHYVIGILIAWIMLLLYNNVFTGINPYLYALIFGVITVIFPFFIMQPAFGFGVMASKTPFPKIARMRSLLSHLYFGIGLCFAWLLVI